MTNQQGRGYTLSHVCLTEETKPLKMCVNISSFKYRIHSYSAATTIKKIVKKINKIHETNDQI